MESKVTGVRKQIECNFMEATERVLASLPIPIFPMTRRCTGLPSLVSVEQWRQRAEKQSKVLRKAIADDCQVWWQGEKEEGGSSPRPVGYIKQVIDESPLSQRPREFRSEAVSE